MNKKKSHRPKPILNDIYSDYAPRQRQSSVVFSAIDISFVFPWQHSAIEIIRLHTQINVRTFESPQIENKK